MNVAISIAPEAVGGTNQSSTVVDGGQLTATGVLASGATAPDDPLHAISFANGGTGSTTTAINGNLLTVTDSLGTLVVNNSNGAYTFTLSDGSAGVETLSGGNHTDNFNFTATDTHVQLRQIEAAGAP